MTVRRYNTIFVTVTDGEETYNAPKGHDIVDSYSIRENRYGGGIVIEADTTDAQHAALIALDDVSEQVGGPVPKQISRSQAILALKLAPSSVNPAPATMHSDIDGYISSLDLTDVGNLMAHTAWKEEPYFERLSPAINTLGAALGISQDALDDLFRSAVSINV